MPGDMRGSFFPRILLERVVPPFSDTFSFSLFAALPASSSAGSLHTLGRPLSEFFSFQQLFGIPILPEFFRYFFHL